LASSWQGPLFRSQPQPALSAQAPFDAAIIAHEAGDVLPNALVEYGLPRHQTEAEPTISCAYRKSNPAILMVQSAQDRAADDIPGPLNAAMHRGILVQ
jgi:hypothetical protein